MASTVNLVPVRRAATALVGLLAADFLTSAAMFVVRTAIGTTPDARATYRDLLKALSHVSQGVHLVILLGLVVAMSLLAAAPLRAGGRVLAGLAAAAYGVGLAARAWWAIATSSEGFPEWEMMQLFWGATSVVGAMAAALTVLAIAWLARAAGRSVGAPFVAAAIALVVVQTLGEIGYTAAVFAKVDVPSWVTYVTMAIAYATSAATIAVAARGVVAFGGAPGGDVARGPTADLDADALRIAGAVGTLKGAFIARFVVGILGYGAVMIAARESPSAAQGLAMLVALAGIGVTLAIAAGAAQLGGLPESSRAGAPAWTAVSFLGASLLTDLWASKLLVDILGASRASSFGDSRLSRALDAMKAMPWVAAAGQALAIVAAIALLLALAAVARWLGEAVAASRAVTAMVFATMAGTLAIGSTLLQTGGRDARSVAPLLLVAGAGLGLATLVLAARSMNALVAAAARGSRAAT